MLVAFIILLFLSTPCRSLVSVQSPSSKCPTSCKCKLNTPWPVVDCKNRNLTAVPRYLPTATAKLDVSTNRICKLPETVFRNYKHLQEIRLVDNNITQLPNGIFDGLENLTKLFLQENRLTGVNDRLLQPLYSLQDLHLDANEISAISPYAFQDLRSLLRLWLDANRLTEIPVRPLSYISTLKGLVLSINFIKSIPDYAFKNLSQLTVLILMKNEIDFIGASAFNGLTNLKILEINENKLTKMPIALRSLEKLQELHLQDNKIEYIPDNSFIHNKKLGLLYLKNNPLISVGNMAFAMLPNLVALELSEVRDQTHFPVLEGCTSIGRLSLDRARITSVPRKLCLNLPKLGSFDIHSNQLEKVPFLNQCRSLTMLNLGNNNIKELTGSPFSKLSILQDLTLSHNHIEFLGKDTFEGLTKLEYLDLQHNRIEHLHSETFLPLKALADLNLGENRFSVLPTAGLQNLKNLKTFNNKYLKDFPSRDRFPRIQYLTLSYAYHCCAFKSDEMAVESSPALAEDIIWLSSAKDYEIEKHNMTSMWKPIANITSSYVALARDLFEGFGSGADYTSLLNAIPASSVHLLEDYRPQEGVEDIPIPRPSIVCKPRPGPFMPCDDLMGWWWLRCGVWVVFLLAVLGNGCVLFVNIISKSRMDVPRFLICNLAGADFLMGIYLGFLAVVDASTLGEFKKHAIKWQTSSGCQVAGFLGVLSSELSVYTLTVITLERYYAITHAMRLNKRLGLKRAGYIMSIGWIFAGVMAFLPLFEISDYRKFAICLPFEIGNTLSLGYVCFLMTINCFAFGVILSCYTKMYCSIRGSKAWNSHDSRIAKRMALLIFTDFACWAPISFLSLTAAFGMELISLDDAKVFTIFVLPLNSCANPFLYAICTKHFKRECHNLCKRIEEAAMRRRSSSQGNLSHHHSWGSSRRASKLGSLAGQEMRMRPYNRQPPCDEPENKGKRSPQTASTRVKEGSAPGRHAEVRLIQHRNCRVPRGGRGVSDKVVSSEGDSSEIVAILTNANGGHTTTRSCCQVNRTPERMKKTKSKLFWGFGGNKSRSASVENSSSSQHHSTEEQRRCSQARKSPSGSSLYVGNDVTKTSPTSLITKNVYIPLSFDAATPASEGRHSLPLNGELEGLTENMLHELRKLRCEVRQQHGAEYCLSIPVSELLRNIRLDPEGCEAKDECDYVVMAPPKKTKYRKKSATPSLRHRSESPCVCAACNQSALSDAGYDVTAMGSNAANRFEEPLLVQRCDHNFIKTTSMSTNNRWDFRKAPRPQSTSKLLPKPAPQTFSAAQKQVVISRSVDNIHHQTRRERPLMTSSVQELNLDSRTCKSPISISDV